MSDKQSAHENKKRATEAVTEPEQAEVKPKAKQPETKKDAPPNKTLPPAAPSAKKTKSKISGLLALLFLLTVLAVAATAVLGWFGYQQLLSVEQKLGERPTHQELRTPLQALNTLAGIENQQLALQLALEETTSRYQSQLAAIQKTLLSAEEPKPQDWQLAEIEHLLRLANQRLMLEEDIAGTLLLLQTAEQQLRQAKVPGTLGVRSLLLEDIETLKALPELDRVSLALSLQSLADKALTLKLQTLPDVPSLNLETATQTTAELSWYQHLWQEVRSLIVVRHRELPIEALDFTEDELLLRQQLNLLILQASWAGLRGEEALYTESLAAATKRLAVFDREQPEIQDFAEQLKTLAEQPVALSLPNVASSLDGLQAFIAQRYKLQLPLEVEGSTSETVTEEEQP